MTRINDEASTDTWSVDETVFADAGITGVTADNLVEVEQELTTNYQAKGAPLTLPEIQSCVNKVVAIMAVDAATGQSNTITVAQLNQATGLATAISQNEALYRSAIEDARGGMFTFDTADDIAGMIDVVNAVALLKDGSVTTDDATSVTPELFVPQDGNGVTYTFTGVSPNGVGYDMFHTTLSIKNRNSGGSLTVTLSLDSDTGFYFQAVDYTITVPASGPITIAIAAP
ncbi:UNVERIFIED_CONTAM: hypothetical protein ABID98_005332 [Brevibacillus sp. OAP136]